MCPRGVFAVAGLHGGVGKWRTGRNMLLGTPPGDPDIRTAYRHVWDTRLFVTKWRKGRARRHVKRVPSFTGDGNRHLVRSRSRRALIPHQLLQMGALLGEYEP